MLILDRKFDERTHEGVRVDALVQPGPGSMTTIQVSIKGKYFQGKLPEPVRGTGSFTVGTQGEFWYSFASVSFFDFIGSTGFSESATSPEIAHNAVSWLIYHSLHESSFNKALCEIRELMRNGEPLVTGWAAMAGGG